jgi:hypothetical protein
MLGDFAEALPDDDRAAELADQVPDIVDEDGGLAGDLLGGGQAGVGGTGGILNTRSSRTSAPEPADPRRMTKS